MGPNLTKLFAEATPEPWFIKKEGWEGQFIYGNDIRTNGERFIADVSLYWDGAEANARKLTLLANHGRALVEALEHNLAAMRWTRDNMPLEWGRAVNSELMNAWDETKQLLAQLETEAQG